MDVLTTKLESTFPNDIVTIEGNNSKRVITSYTGTKT